MSGKIYTRTMDDVATIQDPDDRREIQHEFCLTAHVHFTARTTSEAMSKLAQYFGAVAFSDDDSHDADKMFHAGSMTIAKATHVHVPDAKPTGGLN
jgi:hypothetical protein